MVVDVVEEVIVKEEMVEEYEEVVRMEEVVEEVMVK